MSDRVEEIRERVQAFAPPTNDQNVWQSVGFPLSDIRFLLSEIQRLRKEIEQPAEEWCRRDLDSGERCGKPAEMIVWGKLFPPEALGPRCYGCASDQLGDQVGFRTSILGMAIAVYPLKPRASSLSNTLEQHVPEPVREEMER